MCFCVLGMSILGRNEVYVCLIIYKSLAVEPSSHLSLIQILCHISLSTGENSLSLNCSKAVPIHLPKHIKYEYIGSGDGKVACLQLHLLFLHICITVPLHTLFMTSKTVNLLT